MWSVTLFGKPFFEIYAYFMIYSFLGWAMESAFVSVGQKKWINRGFINGPLCPIYGTGALLVLLTLEPIKDNKIALFFGAILIASLVEYAVGFILEKLFQATWWDYSQMPFNIKGRVCLERSVEWGVLCLFVVRVVQPFIQRFVLAVPRALGEAVGSVLLIYLAVDTTITVLQILRFNEKLAALSESHESLRERLEKTKLYGIRQELIADFESKPAAEFLREWKARMEEEDEVLEELLQEERLRREYLMEEIREKLEHHIRTAKQHTAAERRLMQAFPGMRSKRFDAELNSLKREIEEYRKMRNREDVLK